MPHLQIVIASTRPARKGPAIAAWFERVARSHGKFEVELVDLATVNLPMMDEPEHPRLKKYQHEHTRAWSARVAKADAFVFVTPEYNFSTPPALVNALDYLVQEWAYKPVGYVSYGGVSGGLRSVQMNKQVVTALKMMPLPEAVTLPFFTNLFDESGAFAPGEVQEKAAKVMLDELARWAGALAPLRA
jgi:NAD(P)H-dependent FMN reductase